MVGVWQVKQPTPGLWEELLAALSAGGKSDGLGSIEEAHKESKHEPIGKFVARILETLIARVGIVHARNVVGFTFVGGAVGRFVGGLREDVVGYAHFDVVGFGGKHGDGFVLGFPAKTSDGAIVSAAIGNAANSKLLTNRSSGIVASEDFAILDAVENAQTE